MHFSLQRDGDSLEVELVGRWRGAELPAIDAEIAAQSFAGARRLVVTVPESVELDLAGAGTLREWLKSAENAGLEISYAGTPPGQLALIETTLAGRRHAAPASSSEPMFEPVNALGRQVTRRIIAVRYALDFIGRA